MRTHRHIVFRLAACLTLIAGGASSAEPLQVFTWRDDTATAFPGAVAMIRSAMSYPARNTPLGMPFHTAEPPEFAARELIRELKSRQPDARPVLLVDAGITRGFNGEPDIFPEGDNGPEAYADGGYPGFTSSWMSKFWRLVHSSGVAPSFLILDYERAAEFWGLSRHFGRTSAVPVDVPDAMVGTVVAMQKLQLRLGRSPDGHAPQDYVRSGQSWVWNRTAVTDFNRWFATRRAAALRSAIFEPAWQIFGKSLPATNYSEQERAWRGYDINNWPREPASISGNWSSPSVYLGASGQRYNVYFGNQSPQFRRALRWVDCRNDVRSALAMTSHVAPWYSNPDYGKAPDEDIYEHRLQWAAGLLHDRTMGVSVMLIWSDHEWSPEEVAFARPLFAHLGTMTPNPPTPMDSLREDDAIELAQHWTQIAQTVVQTPESRPATPGLAR